MDAENQHDAGSESHSPDSQRLDHAVAQQRGLSRRQAQRLIADGGVQVVGRPTSRRDKGRLLQPGETFIVTAGPDRLIPNPRLPCTVLAAGLDWVVLDKPPGMPVHPLIATETETLLNVAAARYPQLADPAWGQGHDTEGPLRHGVVHRLDLDTSGCVLLALTFDAWTHLRQTFRTHEIEKTYLAWVQGSMADSAGREALHLAVTQHAPARVRVVADDHPAARLCTLTWQVLKHHPPKPTFNERGSAPAIPAPPKFTLLQIHLETGFLHQIRATFAHMGHPILGDRVYAPSATAAAAPRLLLHAASLTWSGSHAQSPVPETFALPHPQRLG